MNEETLSAIITIPDNLSGYLTEGVEFVKIDRETREIFESKKIIGISDPIGKKDLIDFAYKNDLWHIVRRDSISFIDELLIGLTMLDPDVDIKETGFVDTMKQRPFTFYDFEDSIEFPFYEKKNWSKLIDAYEIFSIALPQNEIVKNTVPLIIDEFFTNAIYNAPVGAIEGWEKHRSNPDGKDYKFPERGLMRMAYGEEHIFIECMDPFGTFNPSDMLKCIKKTYDLGIRDAIREDANRGAGIGLRMVWEKSMSMGVTVKKGEYCTFFSVIPYRIPSKTLTDHPKNIHIVER